MKTLFISLVFAVFTAVTASAQFTGLFYTSSPQSYVGQGKTETIVSGQDGWTFSAYYSYPESNPKDVWFILSKRADNVLVDIITLGFGPELGSDFVIGKTYQATRWPFQSGTNAGMDFSAYSRGNNQLKGSFKLLDLVTGTGGNVISAAFDFYQLDDNMIPSVQATMWSYGSLRFNSDIPLNFAAVPEPSTNVLLTIGLGLLVYFALRGRQQVPS
ncbi:MAG: PEP-CTERM sorting domain-containing protein [Candidatus Taylorbacteria bacterium]|nr:PEP-CTERM sorting domain-containing protein [Candidatus Taylorbacteria bacterium]